MKARTLLLLIIISSIFAFYSCQETRLDPKKEPTIFLSRKSGLVYKDTTLRFNDQVKLEIFCTFNGYDELSKVEVIRKTEENYEIVDEIFVSGNYFEGKKIYKKSKDKIEKYLFVVTDKDGRTGRDSIRLRLFN